MCLCFGFFAGSFGTITVIISYVYIYIYICISYVCDYLRYYYAVEADVELYLDVDVDLYL